MGRKDWYYVHLPKLLTKRLDQFLETPRARSMGMSNKPELLRHVINDFLEEQEGFYKNLESINDFILQIRDRDHLALIYNEKSQFEEIVGTFIKRGINYNQINILVISKREESQFIQSLNKIEKLDSLFNSQDIMTILTDECFPDEFYPVEPLFRQLRSIIELVKEKSKCGLNVIGTLPGRLIEQGKYEDAINIESGWHEAIQKSEIPITPICLYKSIPDNVEERFSEIHDLVIKHAVTSTGVLR
jgi:hypothetical protein